MFDSNDPEEALFVRTATRYYQIYDLATGELVHQSQDLALLGLQFNASEIRQFSEGPTLMDIQTDQGPLRLYNDHIQSPAGNIFLLQVGMSLQARQVALDRFIWLMIWLIPKVWRFVRALVRKLTGAGSPPSRPTTGRGADV